ncbi:hypothetical protein BC941DRAFT_410191 [Chlamydoabsidia padenii]|nr:hypothetical protein BC941DRAFT_410191 [Chlamydoabsidia padenii]
MSDSTESSSSVKSLHFAWFVGHGSLTVTSIIYFLSWLLVHPSNYLYRLSYLAAILTYAISLYNTYKPTVKNSDVAIKRMLLDENSQYLLLAVYFLWTRRITVSLVPFFVYSVFHVAQYAQSSLIPTFAPHASHIGDKLKVLVDQHYNQTMLLVAKYELFVVMGRLLLGLIVFRSSIFSVLLYAHFIRMRYYTSSVMRDTFHSVTEQADHLLLPPTAHPKVPPAVTKAYQTFRDVTKHKKQEQQE